MSISLFEGSKYDHQKFQRTGLRSRQRLEGLHSIVKFKNGVLEFSKFSFKKRKRNVIRANDILKENGESHVAALAANFVFNEAEEGEEDLVEGEVPRAEASESEIFNLCSFYI